MEQIEQMAEVESVEQSSEQWQGLIEATTSAPASLSEYQLPSDGDISPDSMAADQTLRGWMSDLSLPAGVGSHLSEVAEAWVLRTEGWDEGRHQLEQRSTMVTLERLWGDNTANMIELAREAVARLDSQHDGRVSLFLDETMLGNCPQLIAQLAMHEQRRRLR